MTQQEIAVILKNHRHWLLEDCENWENMRADLCGADLRGADLRGADLRGADLRSVSLWGADLSDANLRGANLRGADLYKANLCCADLRGADLYWANLCCADLRGADLYNVNLRGADLHRAKNIPFIPLACPDKGAFTGWEKCKDDYIVELLIPSEAKRLSAAGRMCRCDKAMVISIQNIDGSVADVRCRLFCLHSRCSGWQHR